MVFKDFKDKIRFLRTFKDRAIFFRNLKTSGRPDNVTVNTGHCITVFWGNGWWSKCNLSAYNFPHFITMHCKMWSGKLRNGQGHVVLLGSQSRAFRTLHSAFYFPHYAFYRYPQMCTLLQFAVIKLLSSLVTADMTIAETSTKSSSSWSVNSIQNASNSKQSPLLPHIHHNNNLCDLLA